MYNALTIDVEDYFQVSAFERVVRFEDWDAYECRVEKNTVKILDLLSEFEIKATFFVLGWVAERYPKLVDQIDRRGHEVACHGYSHKLIYNQKPSEFREETRRAKKRLEDIIQKPVWGYRAASYSITSKSLWALPILAEEGFRYDSSVFPIFHDRYGIPGFPRFPHRMPLNGNGTLVECPLTTFSAGRFSLPVAGGGYLRLLPLALTQRLLYQIQEKEKKPVVIYFHPWELDPDQPRLKAPLFSKFRHYVNIDQTEKKLISLLRAFPFAPMRDVLFHMGLLQPVDTETGVFVGKGVG